MTPHPQTPTTASPRWVPRFQEQSHAIPSRRWVRFMTAAVDHRITCQSRKGDPKRWIPWRKRHQERFAWSVANWADRGTDPDMAKWSTLLEVKGSRHISVRNNSFTLHDFCNGEQAASRVSLWRNDRLRLRRNSTRDSLFLPMGFSWGHRKIILLLTIVINLFDHSLLEEAPSLSLLKNIINKKKHICTN